MSLASHYATSRCAISFELFPPKTEAGLESLGNNVRRLTQFKSRLLYLHLWGRWIDSGHDASSAAEGS